VSLVPAFPSGRPQLADGVKRKEEQGARSKRWLTKDDRSALAPLLTVEKERHSTVGRGVP
jgi:hypothetical protein